MARIEHYEFAQIVVDASRSGTTCSSCRIGVVRNWWRQDGHVWHPAPAARAPSAPGAPASPAPLDLPRGVVVVL